MRGRGPNPLYYGCQENVLGPELAHRTAISRASLGRARVAGEYDTINAEFEI
jgi:hypothetical protein